MNASFSSTHCATIKEITANDRVFASVNVCGRTIYNVCLSGYTSVRDIIRMVSNSVQGLADGLVTVILRNSSKGWIERRALRLSRVPAIAAIPEGQQLSLF